MSLEWPPFVFMVIGALLLPFVPKRFQAAAFLLFPALALAAVWNLAPDAVITVRFLKYDLLLCQTDALSRVFGIIFALIALIGGIYSYHIEDNGQRVAALLYAGGALGVTFAGDFLTLLVFWEMMAAASTYLIWARRTRESIRAGMRYLLVHLFGGSVLLAGIVVQVSTTGTLVMTRFAPGESLAACLILFGVAINAAIPPLHAWLSDAYPKATVTGAVFLSAFTTKSAVYVLARLFEGWDILLYFGVAMALYGVVYAVLANDIRQILAYHIISQVGYMVAGVGIGTALAINGTIAHAFSHILYKALLFMGAGVVLQTTGRSKLTELGGLGKYMPLAVWLYMIGAFSISGVPLFNGFISKSIIVYAAGQSHHYAAEFLLILVSVGTFLSIALKLPYWTWYGRDIGLKPERPVPRNMLAGMAILAALCTFFGVFPHWLYRWLPHPMDYQPYTLRHLVEATQLLIFTFVAFWILRAKIAGEPFVALDTDWFYRKPARLARTVFVGTVNEAFSRCSNAVARLVEITTRAAANPLELWQRKRLPRRPFNPDDDRFPMARSLGLTILVVVVAALWSLAS